MHDARMGSQQGPPTRLYSTQVVRHQPRNATQRIARCALSCLVVVSTALDASHRLAAAVLAVGGVAALARCDMFWCGWEQPRGQVRYSTITIMFGFS